MMHVIEVEVVVKITTTRGTTRALHAGVFGGGNAVAVANGLPVRFTLSPPAGADENAWVLLARIASEGARTEQETYG